MTPCSLGDVLLLEITFTDGSGSKPRPVVVVSTERYHQDREDTIVIPLTSQIGSPLRYGDYRITDWSGAGLPKASVAKARPTTVARSSIQKRLGRMPLIDLQGVLSSVKAILG